jgi:hypothetical protein
VPERSHQLRGQRVGWRTVELQFADWAMIEDEDHDLPGIAWAHPNKDL